MITGPRWAGEESIGGEVLVGSITGGRGKRLRPGHRARVLCSVPTASRVRRKRRHYGDVTNVAVTVLSPSMVTVIVVSVPVTAPLQALNAAPAAGVAVSTTSSPLR